MFSSSSAWVLAFLAPSSSFSKVFHLLRSSGAKGVVLTVLDAVSSCELYLNDLEFPRDAMFFFFTTKALYRHSDVEYPDKAFLVFGKETKGLDEELLLNNRESCVRIPMIEEARSLNLSNAVAIATYEVLRQWDYPSLLECGQLHNHTW